MAKFHYVNFPEMSATSPKLCCVRLSKTSTVPRQNSRKSQTFVSSSFGEVRVMEFM